MGKKIRFQKPEIERIPLSDGDWIEIKRDLNSGDTHRLEAAGLKPPTVINGKILSPIDWETYEISRAAIFLVEWSFTDFDDRPTKPNVDTLRALTNETFEEVNRAIFTFVTSRAAEKAVMAAATVAAVGEPKEATPSPQSETASVATS